MHETLGSPSQPAWAMELQPDSRCCRRLSGHGRRLKLEHITKRFPGVVASMTSISRSNGARYTSCRRERRRQGHADEDPQRRLPARRGEHLIDGHRSRSRARTTPGARHRHHLPDVNQVPHLSVAENLFPVARRRSWVSSISRRCAAREEELSRIRLRSI